MGFPREGRYHERVVRTENYMINAEEYLAYLADEAERDIAYDPEPIGRYNVAPGTKVLLLSERNEELHLDPVHWGYAPG